MSIHMQEQQRQGQIEEAYDMQQEAYPMDQNVKLPIQEPYEFNYKDPYGDSHQLDLSVDQLSTTIEMQCLKPNQNLEIMQPSCHSLPRSKPPIICYHCSEIGHMQMSCPSKFFKGYQSHQTLVCFHCHEMGHKKKFCLNKMSRQQHFQKTRLLPL